MENALLTDPSPKLKAIDAVVRRDSGVTVAFDVVHPEVGGTLPPTGRRPASPPIVSDRRGGDDWGLALAAVNPRRVRGTWTSFHRVGPAPVCACVVDRWTARSQTTAR